MGRLIYADALEQSIKDWYCAPERCNSYDGIMCRACLIDDALSEIDRAPTVDAEPVRHGRWTYLNCFEKGRYQCCECGHFIDAGADMNYCPNCGAKMDGDENAAD